MMQLPVAQMTALVALPAIVAAISARLPPWAGPASVIALVGSAVALALLPADSQISPEVAISGFGRGALWVSLLGVGLALIALPGGGGGDAEARDVWFIHVLAVAAILVSRSPLLIMAVTLLLAAALPRLGAAEPSQGWRRSLSVGAPLIFVGLVAAQVSPREISDVAIAAVVLLGFLLVLAAAPFGVGLRLWLRSAEPRLASVVATSIVPALLTTLVDSLGVLNGLHLRPGSSVGLAIAAFGAATLIGAAAFSLTARRWRDLAADGVLADLGLALVAVGAAGLGAAALVVGVLALTRPVLFLADSMDLRHTWARLGTVAAVLTAAGLPPTIGFAARLLVLAAAFRFNATLALAVLFGVILQLAASTRGLVAGLSEDARGCLPAEVEDGAGLGDGVTPARSGPGAMAAVAACVGLSIVGGVFPGVVLSRIWSIG